VPLVRGWGGGYGMTTTTATPTVITEPGVYYDLPDDVYRAQTDWLSVSGAKKLLKPSCPAKFKASIGVEDHKPQFDVGKAFHTKVLGDGPEVVVVTAADWRSKDAQLQRAECYTTGKVPLLAPEAAVVDAMAAAVSAHPVAKHLFTAGKAEVSLFWVDEATGVKCKARLDYLPDPVEGRRLLVPDLKSAVSAEPGEFSRNAARYKYVGQEVWYCDGIEALGLGTDPAFLFVAVEKEAPHVVTVGQFNNDDRKLSAALNDKARRIYAACLATDTWPGYSDGIADLSLPAWHHYEMEEEL
jgi:hypothetical protein